MVLANPIYYAYFTMVIIVFRWTWSICVPIRLTYILPQLFMHIFDAYFTMVIIVFR